MKKVIKRKKESELTRFVWSRRQEYDFALLQEVQARNPFAFKTRKSIWEDIAKTLQEGELKMKVTERSCRERVNELLKKHRKEEASIIGSTGATDDEDSELKKLLVIVNDMANTKPAQAESTLYLKKKKTEGEIIRDAVLEELSDSNSDDYINDNIPRNDSGKESRRTTNKEVITSVNDFFNDAEEERRVEEEAFRRTLHSSDQIHSESWQNIPSSSRDNTYSVPVADLPMQGPPSQPVVPQTSNSSIDQQPSSSSIQRHSDNVPDTQQGSKRSSQNQNKDQKKDDRFSDPKKDLVTFLGKKAEYELDIRKEEVRLREAEVANKTEELRILRIKTEAEVEEKKEELRILRIKSEAEAEERKQIQDLLISLVKKNH